MEDAVLKYIVTPFIAVLGVYIVGTAIYSFFGVPATVLFGAVGGVTFFAKMFKS
jgi:hypothetical protein